MLKVLTKGCEPTRGSKYSACIDLYASEDVTIEAGETKLVGLGVAIDEDKIECIIEGFPKKEWEFQLTAEDYKRSIRDLEQFKSSHYLQLMLRSSLGKKGLILPNGVGIIDLDYKDEIKMIIHNPIIYINKTIDFDCDEDYIELDYMGVSDNDKYVYGQKFIINKGDRIAQITLLEHKSCQFGIYTDKERNGGFGSTGK